MTERRDRRSAVPSGDRKNNRIETQIHRRRKAKASGPMESEWDISQQQPPGQLRMAPPPGQPWNRGRSASITKSKGGLGSVGF
jgi:hypothetical protein